MLTPNDLKIGGSFTEAYYSMVSRQAVAQENLYRIALGKTGNIWLYSTKPNAADNVYAQGGPNSEGFGGATLEFKLWNGCDVIKLKGPWHGNANSLFRDTGIDLRDKHLTFGVIGKRRSHNDGRAVIEDLLWFDKEPTLGSYDRIQKLADKMSHERREVLYYHMQSMGGGSCGPVNWKEYNAQAN